jgi:hypothetical protein
MPTMVVRRDVAGHGERCHDGDDAGSPTQTAAATVSPRSRVIHTLRLPVAY